MKVDPTMFPCWALVDFGSGVRVAGYVEETTVGDQPFLAIKPGARERILVKAAQVTAIYRCNEETALAVARRQWAPPAMSPSRAAR